MGGVSRLAGAVLKMKESERNPLEVAFVEIDVVCCYLAAGDVFELQLRRLVFPVCRARKVVPLNSQFCCLGDAANKEIWFILGLAFDDHEPVLG